MKLRSTSSSCAVPTSGAGDVNSLTDRLKLSLRRIPLLSSILIAGYRLIKVPSRVAQLGIRIESVIDSLATLSDHAKLAVSRIQALEETCSHTNNSIQALYGRIQSTNASQEEVRRALADAFQALTVLHERSSADVRKLLGRLEGLRPAINAGDNLVISQIDGFIMAFPAEEWRLSAYSILIGQPEPGLFALMRSTIHEGMSVVDVGANVGTYTLLALRQIGARGRVISYEPTPRAFDILKNNVQVNGFLETGRIELRRKAVSDGTRAQTRFYVSKHCLGHSSLYADDKLASDEIDVIKVETVSLDDDLANDQRVDVIKIDAEGAEPAILHGMRQIIRNNPQITIFIEFAVQHLQRAHVDPLLYLAEIRDMDLEILEVVEPTGELARRSDQELCGRFSVNLMLRKGR